MVSAWHQKRKEARRTVALEGKGFLRVLNPLLSFFFTGITVLQIAMQI